MNFFSVIPHGRIVLNLITESLTPAQVLSYCKNMFHHSAAHIPAPAPPPCFWQRFQLDRSVCRQSLSFLPKNLDEATCRESLGLEGASWEPKNKRSAAPAGPPSKLRPSQMWEIWALHFWGAEKKKEKEKKKPSRMAKHAKQRQPHKAGLVGGHSEGGGAERGRERKTGREEEQCFQCRPSRLGLMGVSLLQFHFNRVTRRFICFAVLQPIEMLVREPMRRCMAPLCTNG